MGITHKVCSRKNCARAGQMLPVSQFSRKKNTRDGLQCECTQCRSADQAKWRRQQGIRSREELADELDVTWPLPAPADLNVQLLGLHARRAYGATPGQLVGRIG